MQMKHFVLALLFLGLCSCATLSEKQSSAEVEVSKGAPVVYIYPLDSRPYRKYSVGVLPFLLPNNMDERMGKRVASLYKDVLLGKRVFPRVKLLQEQYGDYEDAMAAGSKYGVDLVLAGIVNYAIEGTELGGTRLDISVRLLNVSSGETVWYIGQAMDQPLDYPKSDMLSFLASSIVPPKIKRQEGAPVMANMLAQSAVDIADVMSGEGYIRR